MVILGILWVVHTEETRILKCHTPVIQLGLTVNRFWGPHSHCDKNQFLVQDLNSDQNIFSSLFILFTSNVSCLFTFDLEISAVCLLIQLFVYMFSCLFIFYIVCLHKQLFVYIFNCLFTYSDFCLHIQLFVYIFTCLFTYSVVCLLFQLIVYIFICLFTLSVVCLLIQLFVYIFSCLFTHSAVSLHIELFV